MQFLKNTALYILIIGMFLFMGAGLFAPFLLPTYGALFVKFLVPEISKNEMIIYCLSSFCFGALWLTAAIKLHQKLEL